MNRGVICKTLRGFAANDIRVHAGTTDVLADFVDQQDVDFLEWQGGHEPLGHGEQLRFALLDVDRQDGLDVRRGVVSILDDRETHFYRHAGYVRVAFRLAFWELLHAPTFAAAVLDCANRGGDADTNAAIAGALYGALAGEEAIDPSWRARVIDACTGPGWAGNVWADEYHPRRLFRAAAAAPHRAV